MKPIITRVVEGVHMGLGHDGINSLLKKEGLDVKKLSFGELVLCLNKRGDKLKVMGSKGLVIGYLKMPKGERILKESLQYLPQAFGSSGFNYDQACKEALMKRLYGKEKIE